MGSFDEILRRVRHPSRYLGGEYNAVHKDPDGLGCRVALAYPDLYGLAMSYLGLSILYDAVNREPDLWAERVFAPDVDMQAELKNAGLKLATLESSTPLDQYDLIGFTLQHELNCSDVLAMLEMGGVPAHANRRLSSHPFVIAGGPGATNPEPLAPALDAVFLGDGELGLSEIARIVGRGRRQDKTREQILDELMELPGVYIPSRYSFVYADGYLREVEALRGAPPVVRRRVLPDIGQVAVPACPVVPGSQTVHERLTVEIQRGCTRGCRFCQAGMINRPVRQRARDSVLAAVSSGLARTGFDQVSFLSLSAGDYPGIIELLDDFYSSFAAQKISASLPSLRAETLTPALADLIKTVRKSGFTIAPEAGSDRLRRVINKQQSDLDVIQAARDAFAAGWRLIKLYFMVGLPTETDEDRGQIPELVARMRRELKADGHRPQINVGISTFVPKPHTPFQWEPMVAAAQSRRIIKQLRRELAAIPGVKVGFHQPEMSWAEGLVSRGDRRQFAALETLVDKGLRLAGWSEHFSLGHFEAAFEPLDLPGGTDHYLRRRDPEELLPWDHLDMGPGKEFLQSERRRAELGECTADCRLADCHDCGACGPDELVPVLDDSTRSAREAPPARIPDAGPGNIRVRLTLSKTGPAVHLSHLEFKEALVRSLRRAGWPLSHSSGFHPLPKTSFGPACPVGVESRAELVDVGLTEKADLEGLLTRLRAALPGGIGLLEGNLLAAGTSSIMKQATAVRYRIRPGDEVTYEGVCHGARDLLERMHWKVNRMVKGKSKTVDVRPSLLSCQVERASGLPELVCELKLNSGPIAKPLDVAREVCGQVAAGKAFITREAIVFRAEQGT